MVEATGAVGVSRVVIEGTSESGDHCVIGGGIVTHDAQALYQGAIGEYCCTLIRVNCILTDLIRYPKIFKDPRERRCKSNARVRFCDFHQVQ